MAAVGQRQLSWMGLLIFLAILAGCTIPPSKSSGAASPTAVPTACNRFSSLPPTHQNARHSPPVPDLPPAPARQQIAFRHAVHTLFLDEITAPLAADLGFDTVVQVFPWRDLNPEPGFYDWNAADYMVRMARQHNLDLVVRLDMPPKWAALPVKGGIPFDVAAYVDFVSAVASRYRSHILGYIIWNEPNLAAEWSRSGSEDPDRWVAFEGWVADPADYTAVLGAAYQRIKTADPETLVIGGGLAPTNENTSRAVDDRLFLEQMLAAGAAGCFDILAVHDYGYGLSPKVDRTAQDGLNLARVMDLRDILLARNAARPIWITELGYTIQPGDHPSISEDEQALYLLGAFERTRQEWPWVEMLTVWNLAYGLPYHDGMSGFSLVESDGTPRLAYEMLRLMEKGRLVIE
jgi:hypothetical protein